MTEKNPNGASTVDTQSNPCVSATSGAASVSGWLTSRSAPAATCAQLVVGLAQGRHHQVADHRLGALDRVHHPRHHFPIGRIDIEAHRRELDLLLLDGPSIVFGRRDQRLMAPVLQRLRETHIRVHVAVRSPARDDDARHVSVPIPIFIRALRSGGARAGISAFAVQHRPCFYTNVFHSASFPAGHRALRRRVVGFTPLYRPIGLAQSETVRHDIDETMVAIGRGDVDFNRAKGALLAWKQFDLGWVEVFPRLHHSIRGASSRFSSAISDSGR